MYKIEKLGKIEMGKCYVYSIGRKMIVTNVSRSSVSNTRKILSELARMKVLKNFDDNFLEKNLDMLHRELKNKGSLHKFVTIEFEKITNENDNTEVRHYSSLKSDNFGGGYDMNEIRIVMI